MNFKKLSIIGLSTCALLFSCNKDTKITKEDAIKYAEEHFKLTETPDAKKGYMSWDFKDTDENLAMTMFDVMKANLKDTSTKFSMTGKGEVNDSALKACAGTYATVDDIKALSDNAEIYTNKIGLKYKISITESEISYNTTFQFDSTGRTVQNIVEQECKAEVAFHVVTTCDLEY